MDSSNSTDGDAALALRRAQAREAEAKQAAHKKRVALERMVLLPILLLALLAWPNFGIGKVVGHSMEPRYHTGDTLYLLRTYHYFSPIKPGDVVVIKLRHGKTAGEEIVKRVMFVQNKTANAKWPAYLPSGRGDIAAALWFPNYVGGAETVPVGGIVVMGDNIMNSMDSRDFGPVYPSEIIGKVLNP